MTEEEFRKEEAAQGQMEPRPLSPIEAEGVRQWIAQQTKLQQLNERIQTVETAPSPGPIQVARALPHLPVGWANGFKTSEFWTAVAGMLLAVAKGYGYDIPEDAFWPIVAYIVGRSGMKSAAAYRSGIKQ